MAVQQFLVAVAKAAASSAPVEFVAVGNGGTLLTSPDGVTWTSQVTGSPKNLRSVAGTMATGTRWSPWETAEKSSPSRDGVNWTQQVSGTTNDLYSVTYATTSTFSGWIAVGGRTRLHDSATVLTSNDGVTWKRTAPAQIANQSLLTSVTWAGAKLLAVGYAGDILTCPSGSTAWSQQSTGVHSMHSIAYSLNPYFQGSQTSGLLAAVGTGVATGMAVPSITYSTTGGASWLSPRPSAPTLVVDTLNSVTWTNPYDGTPGDGWMVAVGVNGYVQMSSNGDAWTLDSTGSGVMLNSVVWTDFSSGSTNGMLVAVGDNGTILTAQQPAASITPLRRPNAFHLQFTASRLFGALPNPLSGQATAAIYTVSGNKLVEARAGSNGGFSLPLNSIGNGSYLLEVKSPAGRTAQPFNLAR